MAGIKARQSGDKARAISDGQKVFSPRSSASRSNAAAISALDRDMLAEEGAGGLAHRLLVRLAPSQPCVQDGAHARIAGETLGVLANEAPVEVILGTGIGVALLLRVEATAAAAIARATLAQGFRVLARL